MPLSEGEVNSLGRRMSSVDSFGLEQVRFVEHVALALVRIWTERRLRQRCSSGLDRNL